MHLEGSFFRSCATDKFADSLPLSQPCKPRALTPLSAPPSCSPPCGPRPLPTSLALPRIITQALANAAPLARSKGGLIENLLNYLAGGMILAEGSQGLWRGLSDSAQLLAQPASSSFPAWRPEQPCSSLAEPQAVSSPGAVAWLGDSRAVPLGTRSCRGSPSASSPWLELAASQAVPCTVVPLPPLVRLIPAPG